MDPRFVKIMKELIETAVEDPNHSIDFMVLSEKEDQLCVNCTKKTGEKMEISIPSI